MKKKALLPLFLGIMIFLAGCDYSTPEKQDGFFFNTFVQPMKHLLQWLGNDVFHNNFGLAIIVFLSPGTFVTIGNVPVASLPNTPGLPMPAASAISPN